MQFELRVNNIYEQAEAILATMQLGDIASDHRAETEGFNGWNYVAITAVAKQATRSLVYVYDDRGTQQQAVRKSLRLVHGAQWRKALVREHQGEVLDAVHPLVKLLNRPNPHQSGGSFRWEQIQQLRLHGSCLVFNRPNMAGTRTVERYVVPMSMITPIKPGRYRNMPRGGILINPTNFNGYMMRSGDTFSPLQQFVNIELPAEMLTIIKYPHPMLRGDGASPTYAASPWIDAATMVDKTRADFYRDGPNGKMLIQAELNTPAEVQELEDRLSRRLGEDGPRVTVVGNGATVATKQTADDMAFSEGHDQLRDAILAAHGVSRAMVGSQEGMTYGSLAASLLGTTMLSIQPDMDLIADEETVTLGAEYGEGVCVEYEVPAINDPELEDRRLQQDAALGVMTVGEYRMKRGEPLFGTEYDTYILTGSGAVAPDSLIKTKPSTGDGIPDPVSPDFDMPEIGGMEMKSVSSDGSGLISIDETLLELLDAGVIDAFHESGFEMQPMMETDSDDKRTPEAVWDWTQGTDYRGIVKSLKPGARLTNLVKSLEVLEQKQRKYACILLPLPQEFSNKIVSEGMHVPDDNVAAGGRETEPHVTLLYGILGADIDEIVRVVSRLEAPLVKFGGQDASPGGDDGFPMYVRVESPDLAAANAKVRELLPHVVKYPNYQPHATVAYVNNPEPYIGYPSSLTGKSCYLPRAIISMPDGQKVVVPLRRPYVAPDPKPEPDMVDGELLEKSVKSLDMVSVAKAWNTLDKAMGRPGETQGGFL